MQIGIFSVGDVTTDPTTGITPTEGERIQAMTGIALKAEEVGLDVFATGEHHNPPFAAPPNPTVLLAHRPEFLAQYADHGADVVLSGHAHGGQVRLPLIGPLFAPHQGWLPALTEGVHRQGDTAMVISRGLGNSVVGVRVNNPRELVVVDLVQ